MTTILHFHSINSWEQFLKCGNNPDLSSDAAWTYCGNKPKRVGTFLGRVNSQNTTVPLYYDTVGNWHCALSSHADATHVLRWVETLHTVIYQEFSCYVLTCTRWGWPARAPGAHSLFHPFLHDLCHCCWPAQNRLGISDSKPFALVLYRLLYRLPWAHESHMQWVQLLATLCDHTNWS